LSTIRGRGRKDVGNPRLTHHIPDRYEEGQMTKTPSCNRATKKKAELVVSDGSSGSILPKEEGEKRRGHLKKKKTA